MILYFKHIIYIDEFLLKGIRLVLSMFTPLFLLSFYVPPPPISFGVSFPPATRRVIQPAHICYKGNTLFRNLNNCLVKRIKQYEQYAHSLGTRCPNADTTSSCIPTDSSSAKLDPLINKFVLEQTVADSLLLLSDSRGVHIAMALGSFIVRIIHCLRVYNYTGTSDCGGVLEH